MNTAAGNTVITILAFPVFRSYLGWVLPKNMFYSLDALPVAQPRKGRNKIHKETT